MSTLPRQLPPPLMIGGFRALGQLMPKGFFALHRMPDVAGAL